MRAWLLAVLLAGCAHERPCDGPPRTLYVVGHGWHSGIVVERADLARRLPQIDLGEARYAEIGWGEARFYPARDTTVGMALRAVLWRNDSVLQVVPFAEPPRRYFPASEVKELRTDDAGYHAALAEIAATFSSDAAPLGPSLYGNGSFYRAEGSFHLFSNCHHWVGRVLDAARCRLPAER